MPGELTALERRSCMAFQPSTTGLPGHLPVPTYLAVGTTMYTHRNWYLKEWLHALRRRCCHRRKEEGWGLSASPIAPSPSSFRLVQERVPSFSLGRHSLVDEFPMGYMVALGRKGSLLLTPFPHLLCTWSHPWTTTTTTIILARPPRGRILGARLGTIRGIMGLVCT